MNLNELTKSFASWVETVSFFVADTCRPLIQYGCDAASTGKPDSISVDRWSSNNNFNMDGVNQWGSTKIDHYILTELSARASWHTAATRIIYREFLELWIRPYWSTTNIRNVRRC